MLTAANRVVLLLSLFCLVLSFFPPALAEAGESNDSVQVLLERGLAFVQGGDYGSAMEVYNQVLQREPRNSEALYRLGILSYLEKDYGKAASYFERSVQSDAEKQDPWKRLGDSQERLGRFKEAAQSYGRACLIEYERSLQEREGRAWFSAREFEKSRKIFESLVLEDPGDYHAVYYLGNVVLAMGDPSHAERCYQAAIRLRPELVEAYVNLASIRFNTGKFSEAAGFLEKTFQVSPKSAPEDPTVRLNLGLAYLKVPDPKKAQTHLQKFLDLCPGCPQADEVRGLIQQLGAGNPSDRQGSESKP
jgi:tetratricopeptide (TPR) repeat protein